MRSFEDEKAIHRGTTLAMLGISEEQLTAEQIAALDRYEAAYADMYLSKWGKDGPRGAVLRMEEAEETETRIAFEELIRPLQERLRKEYEML